MANHALFENKSYAYRQYGKCSKSSNTFLFPFLKCWLSGLKGVLAIRCIFSLVDMITNTKFSHCPYVFKIGLVRQQNMHSKQQNMFQSDSPFTIS